MKHCRETVIVLLSAVLLGSSASRAGDLNPPAGPVAPTMKDLDTVEPRIPINATNTPGDANSFFRITQPGSYFLPTDIAGGAGRNGIEIVASNVTIDLRGFSIIGVAGSLDGISVDPVGASNLMIHNGTVRGWGQDGIDLSQASNSIVRLVRVEQNGANGITTSFGCSISNCVAASNGGDGIITNSGCTITHCTASANTQRGITSGSRSIISNCAATSNGSDGIAPGIAGSLVDTCTAGSNGATGIFCSNFTSVMNCTVQSNGAVGIRASLACDISNCLVTGSATDGILVANQCRVISNVCDTNGSGGSGAGIHVSGSDARIEDNQCTQNDRGIDVDAAGNFIIRNTCSGNTTNWDIVANNVVGPILDRTAPASAAIVGNSAPDSTGSTHPNANFSY